jgi:bifunctional non-homologous end joining protein LigD
MPRNITPMLAYLENEPFENPSWIFEIKWDGFRAIAEVKNAHVNLYSRNFKSFNQRYPTVVEALKRLKINAVFDGEIVILNKKGISDFQSLQNYQKTGEGDLRYYIFDLLYYKDKDLRGHPLMERKQRLQKLLPTDPKSILQYSKHVVGQGKKFFALAKKKNLEGMIAKDGESPYLS